MALRKLSEQERRARTVPAKVTDPKEGEKVLRRATSVVKTKATLDFVRDVRGR
jgi:hypothetical protein